VKDLTDIDAFRRRDREVLRLYRSFGDGGNGMFSIPCPRTGVFLQCIASNGEGWDHVSVSLPNRCPNWMEMELVKRMFFNDEETAMQLHVPPSDHVNKHPNCLHLWRPNDGREIPRPPAEFVG
jgi:hypothetical protein